MIKILIRNNIPHNYAHVPRARGHGHYRARAPVTGQVADGSREGAPHSRARAGHYAEGSSDPDRPRVPGEADCRGGTPTAEEGEMTRANARRATCVTGIGFLTLVLVSTAGCGPGALLVMTLVGGAAAVSGEPQRLSTTQGQDFDEQRVPLIQSGVHTQSDVVSIMGNPQSKVFTNLGEEWSYRYLRPANNDPGRAGKDPDRSVPRWKGRRCPLHGERAVGCRVSTTLRRLSVPHTDGTLLAPAPCSAR